MADNYLSDPTLYNANKTIKPRHNFDQEGGNNLPPAEGELGYPGDQEQVVHENQTTKSQNALKAQIFNEYERTFRYLTNILGNVHDPVILDGVEEVTDIGDALRRLFNRVSSAGMQAFTPRLIAMTSGMGIVRSQKTDPSGFTYFGDYPPSYQEANFFPEQGKQFDILGGPEPDDPSNPSKYYLYIEQGFGVTDSGVTNPNPNDFYGTEDIPVVKIEVNAATLGDNADWDHVLDDYTVPPPVIDGTTGANEVIWTDHGIYLEGKIALTEDCSTWIEEDGVYINGVRYNLLIVEATGGLETVEGVQKIVNPTEIYDIGGAGIFEICEGPYVEPHGGTEGGWDRPCHNARCGIFITTLGPATTPQIDPSTKKYYAYFKRYRPQWYLIQSGIHKDPNTNVDIDGINVVEIEDPDETIRTAENIPLYAIYVDHPSRGISKIVDLRKYINFMGHNDSATYESLEERLKASGNTKAIADRPEFTLGVADNPGVIAPTYTLNIINDSYIYGSKTGDEEGFLYVGNLKELSIHRSTFTITGTGTLILDITPDDPIQVGDKIWQPYKDGYKYHGEVTGASGTNISYNDVNSGITQNIRELIFIREVTSIELDTVEQTHDGANYTFYRKGNFFYFPDGVFGSLTDTPDTNTVLREVDVDTGTEYTGKVCRIVTTYETNVEGIDYDVVQVDDAQHFEIDGRAEFVFNHTGNTDCLVGEILDTDKFVEDIYIDGTYVGRTSNMDSTIKNDEYSYNIGSNGHEWTSRTRRILIWKTTIEEAHESWNANKFVIAIPLINERAIWYRDRIITAETTEEDGLVITNVPYSYGRVGRHGIILNPDESDYGYAALTGENIRFHHTHGETIRDFFRDEVGYTLIGRGVGVDPGWSNIVWVDEANRSVRIAWNVSSISSLYAAIVGGHDHDLSGDNSVIIGGNNNTIEIENAIVLAGAYNSVTGSAVRSSIIGGNENTIAGTNSHIIGGNSNTIDASNNHIIISDESTIESGSSRSTIVASLNSSISDSSHSHIISSDVCNIEARMSGIYNSNEINIAGALTSEYISILGCEDGGYEGTYIITASTRAGVAQGDYITILGNDGDFGPSESIVGIGDHLTILGSTKSWIGSPGNECSYSSIMHTLTSSIDGTTTKSIISNSEIVSIHTNSEYVSILGSNTINVNGGFYFSILGSNDITYISPGQYVAAIASDQIVIDNAENADHIVILGSSGITVAGRDNSVVNSAAQSGITALGSFNSNIENESSGGIISSKSCTIGNRALGGTIMSSYAAFITGNADGDDNSRNMVLGCSYAYIRNGNVGTESYNNSIISSYSSNIGNNTGAGNTRRNVIIGSESCDMYPNNEDIIYSSIISCNDIEYTANSDGRLFKCSAIASERCTIDAPSLLEIEQAILIGTNNSDIIDSGLSFIIGGGGITIDKSPGSGTLGSNNCNITYTGPGIIGYGSGIIIKSYECDLIYTTTSNDTNDAIIGSSNCTITDGTNNSIISSTTSDITDGYENVIIGSGGSHITSDSRYNFIAGCYNSTISGAGAYSNVMLARDSTIDASYGNAIVAGRLHEIEVGCNYNAIIGGDSNSIIETSTWTIFGYVNPAYGHRCAIIGGYSNYITGDTRLLGADDTFDSVIIGGYECSIVDNGSRSAVIAGHENTIDGGNDSVVVGGYQNEVTGERSAILGGYSNLVTGDYSVACGYNISTTGNRSFGYNGTTTYHVASDDGTFYGWGSIVWNGSARWTSDTRFKDNQQPLLYGLAEIKQLNPISFTYNGLGNTIKGMESIGLIAQDVESIIPDIVSKKPETLQFGDHYFIDPLPLIYILINAVKELEARITALENP